MQLLYMYYNHEVKYYYIFSIIQIIYYIFKYKSLFPDVKKDTTIYPHNIIIYDYYHKLFLFTFYIPNNAVSNTSST